MLWSALGAKWCKIARLHFSSAFAAPTKRRLRFETVGGLLKVGALAGLMGLRPATWGAKQKAPTYAKRAATPAMTANANAAATQPISRTLNSVENSALRTLAIRLPSWCGPAKAAPKAFDGAG